MSVKARKTGFVCHELYMWHNTGNYAGPMPYGNPVQPDTHAENPETKRRFRNLLEVAGALDVPCAVSDHYTGCQLNLIFFLSLDDQAGQGFTAIAAVIGHMRAKENIAYLAAS